MHLDRMDAELATDSGLVESPIEGEIRTIIAGARASGEILRMGAHVSRLELAYGRAGVSRGRIEEELIRAAAHASIPLEMNRER